MCSLLWWPKEPDSVRHGAGKTQEFCETDRCRSDNNWIFIFPPDECGIVAQISEPLAAADIPAYYISTFKFDHALVSIKTASLE